MGEVYLARLEREFPQQVAVKVIREARVETKGGLRS